MNKITAITVYGVEMTSIQEMKFSQYLNRGDVPAMNTLTKEERYSFTNDWLQKLGFETKS